MYRFLNVFFFILMGLTVKSQSFNQFTTRLLSLPEGQRQAIADSFLTANPTAPHLESDTICNFYFAGSSQSVSIAGDFTSWDPTTHPMTKIPGTTFWYLTRFFPADTRADYKIVKNGSSWILDPRNPWQSMGGFGPNSELRMPQYNRPVCVDYIQNIPHGSFVDTTFYSTYLGNSRSIRVYLPAGYPAGNQRYPVVYFHDGLEYVTLGKANNTLDYLIQNQIIRPVIGVFVPPVNRTDEYAGGLQDEFTDFFTDELVPWVDSRFNTIPEAASRATLGASNGGNIALWLMASHPEMIAKTVAHSSNVENNILNTFQSLTPQGLRTYLDMGTYDLEILKGRVDALKLVLNERDFDYVFYPVNDGHSWANWRDHLKDALIYLFPATQGIYDPIKAPLNGLIRPNPVRGEVTVEVENQSDSKGQIRLFDVNGQMIVKNWILQNDQDRQLYKTDLSDIIPGIYLVTISNAELSGTLKLIKD